MDTDAQRWLRNLVDSMDAVAWEADPATLRFRYVSPAAERLLGFPVAAWLEPDFWIERLLPDDRERAVGECLTATAAGGAQHRLEYRLVAADGSAVPIEDSVEVVRDGDEVVGLHGILVNATARRDDEENFRFLVENGSDIVSIVAADGTIAFQSRAVERVLGYSAAEMVGRDAFEYVHPDDRWKARQAFGVARLSPDFADPVELRVRHRDGSWRHIEAISRGLRRGVLVSSRDITAQRRAIEAQKMEALGRLAGSIAHDFNNVLLVIRGHGELLREDVPAAAADKLDEIIRAAERGAALTHQLLSFGRRRLTQLGACDPGETIRSLCTLLRPVLGESTDLMVHVEPGTGHVRMGSGYLEQIMLNLLLNARDALPDGGTISVFVWETRGRVRIRVIDSGIGMDEETRLQIFEPYYTTKDESSGTGLGLATTFAIVREHEGTIEVESALGAGTTFDVDLPAVSGR